MIIQVANILVVTTATDPSAHHDKRHKHAIDRASHEVVPFRNATALRHVGASLKKLTISQPSPQYLPNLKHKSILQVKSQQQYNLTSLKSQVASSGDNIERTAPDSKSSPVGVCWWPINLFYISVSAGFFSKTFENVVRLLPPVRIGSRQNPGCVGGTKCQFFVFCWMSGGSLGASCGPLHTCCVTPSSQDIQPQYWGPVVNDPRMFILEHQKSLIHASLFVI